MQLWRGLGQRGKYVPVIMVSLTFLFAVFLVLALPGARPVSVEGAVAEAETTPVTAGVMPVQIPILMYHSISSEPNNRLCIAPADFARQLDWLRDKGYNTITMKDYLLARLTGGSLPPKPVVITLDDGYDDNYLAAFPLLKERGMRATVFMIGNKIGRKGYLSKDQIIEMRDYGIEFGSHSMTHADLKKSGLEVQRSETRDSKRLLEDTLGIEVVTFCYPSGQYNQGTIDAVKMAGYLGAVTVEPGVVSDKSRVFELPRVRVYGIGDLINNLRQPPNYYPRIR